MQAFDFDKYCEIKVSVRVDLYYFKKEKHSSSVRFVLVAVVELMAALLGVTSDPKLLRIGSN